jgi:hypothetical protein
VYRKAAAIVVVSQFLRSSRDLGYSRSWVKALGIQIDDLLLVIERDAISGTEHNLQHRRKSRDVSAGALFVNDNTRANIEFSISFSDFHVVPPVNFHPTPEVSRSVHSLHTAPMACACRGLHLPFLDVGD